MPSSEGVMKPAWMQSKELHVLFVVVAAIFVVFLVLPMLLVLVRSFTTAEGLVTLQNYVAILSEPDFLTSVTNSLKVSAAAALVSVLLAFLLSYTVNCTNLPSGLRRAISLLTQVPMLLPTITYGFAIIYSFGRQGLLTQIFGYQLFDIYGFNGLLIGYVIYTLPTSFMLIDNSFKFVDKRFMIVSRIMGDSAPQTFLRTIVRPLINAMCVAFILSFFLSFTDYGIPTSVGGTYDTIALQLYNQMLGAIPDFNKGAVIAVVMLIPSVLSIIVMTVLERHAITYDKISPIELPKSRIRDTFCAVASIIVLICVLSIFVVIVIVPFVDMWPFKMEFTLDHMASVFTTPELSQVFTNSLLVAVLTAFFGCIIAYAAALVTARSNLSPVAKRLLDSVSSIINTVPGMVLGVAYLFAFSGGPLQSTFAILIFANIVHYFATPYQMMKDSLTKMNASWETTAKLMGDSWLKTIVRIVTPNAWPTILQVFGYYFVNAMVTISAVVFLTGAHTMVVTTQISSLQHTADFDSIFALSLLILAINLAVKGIIALVTRKQSKKKSTPVTKFDDLKAAPGEKRPNKKTVIGIAAVVVVIAAGIFAGTSGQTNPTPQVTAGQVVIYSNADDEALTAYENALDANGFEGKYILQSFGTSELGGKLMAEGTNIEADLITMSSYYIDSAQEDNHMFQDLTDVQSVSLVDDPSYRASAQAQEGAIFFNTTVMEQEGLPVPTSFKDLADPIYEGMISVPDIDGSSTGWLMIQALIDSYGEDEAREILTGIYRNAGPYLSQSGSAPIKNVRAGEVAIGFGLRHQAMADKAEGLPIDFIDPAEGTYSLTESVAVIDKGESTNPDAQKMAAVIIDEGRAELIQTYSKPLYENETEPENGTKNPKTFSEPLTVDLLEYHREFSDECKKAAQG